ncbi:hypothetical protein ES708_34523 [subsurface metagenome]
MILIQGVGIPSFFYCSDRRGSGVYIQIRRIRRNSYKKERGSGGKNEESHTHIKDTKRKGIRGVWLCQNRKNRKIK